MGKRRKNIPEEPKVETRKQTRVRLSVQRRNRRITMIVGGVLALALILVIVGIISEMVIKPNSVLARVEGRPIVTRDFWERTRLRQGELQSQLQQYQIFSAQFGDQNIFASQIAQIQATLSSPLSLGTQVLNQMIDEQVIRIRAEELGITVTDAEVDEALREEIARGQGAVTVPQATATAEAGAEATATALLFTPTPTVAVTETETITDTDAVLGTGEPATPEPPTILTDELYQQGLATLSDTLRQRSGISLDGYREIIRTQLLAEKLQEQIGAEQVAATEEQIEVRHILIRFDETAGIAPGEEITETEEITPDAEIAPDEEITEGEDATDEPVAETETESETLTDTEPVTETVTLTVTNPLTGTEVVTSTETVTDTETLTDTETETVADDEPVAESEVVTDTETTVDPAVISDESRDEAAALALAQELRERILAGEDFAQLAAIYSEDPGSGMDGGNLGWVGRGAFVPEFEEAAFALPIGEISQPVRSQFGYHLIEVLNRDENRPKDENQLRQERAQAFNNWLQEQILSLNIERPTDLPSRLPAGL
ncbi:MAG: peptidylprolyl isomerase [Caldilineaceae bacterium]|nr:peptidylprolyl isomerase [Caldilineaceae bacterium]